MRHVLCGYSDTTAGLVIRSIRQTVSLACVHHALMMMCLRDFDKNCCVYKIDRDAYSACYARACISPSDDDRMIAIANYCIDNSGRPSGPTVYHEFVKN